VWNIAYCLLIEDHPMAKHVWTFCTLVILAAGCGTQQKFSPGPSAQEEAPMKTANKPSRDATKSTKVTPVKEEVDCDGVKVHVGHPSCDKDDVQVSNGDVETPNPVIVQNPPSPPAPPASLPAPTPAPAPAPNTPPQDPNVVVFRIKAGTGNQPWNTADTMVTVKVGQTLRIVNDDTVTHRLHTGGAPCPHGTNFGPGASYDCVATRALDPAATPGRTYDHIVGDTALFFVKAVP
jgi:hypothetical protein